MGVITSSKSQLRYSIKKKVVTIDMLESSIKEKGGARRIMNRLLKKYNGRRFELFAYGQDYETDTNRLVKFYKSLGFNVDCGDEKFGFEMSKD